MTNELSGLLHMFSSTSTTNKFVSNNTSTNSASAYNHIFERVEQPKDDINNTNNSITGGESKRQTEGLVYASGSGPGFQQHNVRQNSKRRAGSERKKSASSIPKTQAKAKAKAKTEETAEQRYRRKRHKNSRLGCLNCKKRRVKCGEEPDICYNCMEKNVRCSFQDLLEEDKQLLRNNYAAGLHSQSWSLPPTQLPSQAEVQMDLKKQNLQPSFSLDDMKLEKEFEALVKKGYFFGVEQMSIRKAKLITCEKYPNEESFCSVIDFEQERLLNHWGVALVDRVVRSRNHIQNHNHSSKRNRQQSDQRAHNTYNVPTGLKPLPFHSNTPTTFGLYKVNRKYLLLETLPDDGLHKITGEDDPIYVEHRRGLAYYYQTFIEHGLISGVSFHEGMTLCGSVALNQKAKILRESESSDQSSLAVLAKFILAHKVTGLKLAQEVIDKLNCPKNLSSEEYLFSAHNIVAYSLASVGVSVICTDRDYQSLLAFTRGFISTVILKQVVQRFTLALEAEKIKNSLCYYRYRFAGLFFPYIHSFIHKNATMLYVPNYNFTILKEFHYDLVEFKDYMAVHGLLERKIHSEVTEIDSFLNNYIFQNRKLFESYDSSYVSHFKPAMLYPIISQLWSIFSGTPVHIQYKYKSISPIERIVCLYWMTLPAILDSLFPETIFLFILRYAGAVTMCGCDISFINSILDDLKLQYEHSDPQLYDFLYRKTIYLTRVQSFFSYRWRIYDRNIRVSQIYPDTTLFEKVRYESRKLNFVNETQITSLKYDVVKFVNYPRNNRDFTDDNTELGLARPNHRKYVKFLDTNFHVNINFDENFETVQKELNRRIKIYRLLNSSHGPNDSDHLNLQEKLRDEHFGKYYSPPNDKSMPTLSGFNINTFPLHLMKLSEYGLLLNIDHRPDLTESSKERMISNQDFFEKNLLELNYVLNDWNLIMEHSAGL